MFHHVVGTVMAQVKTSEKHDQVSVIETIRCYGERAVQAILKEYAQLH